MTNGQGSHRLEVALITGLLGGGQVGGGGYIRRRRLLLRRQSPPQMLSSMVELFVLEGSRVNRAAVVLDARGRPYFEHLDRALELLRASDVAVRVVYLEATDEALVARYQATRRPHPLSVDLLEGIALERTLLAPLRAQADVIATLPPSPLGFAAATRRDITEPSERQESGDPCDIVRIPLRAAGGRRYGSGCPFSPQPSLGT